MMVDLSATIDPVLAEHYPGLGLTCRVSTTSDGYEVTAADGRCVAVDAATVERAIGDVPDRWHELFLRALFTAIDERLGSKP